MRRFVGICPIMLALAACQNLPGFARIEVDGSTLEFKKKVPPAQDPTLPVQGNSADAPER